MTQLSVHFVLVFFFLYPHVKTILYVHYYFQSPDLMDWLIHCNYCHLIEISCNCWISKQTKGIKAWVIDISASVEHFKCDNCLNCVLSVRVHCSGEGHLPEKSVYSNDFSSCARLRRGYQQKLQYWLWQQCGCIRFRM